MIKIGLLGVGHLGGIHLRLLNDIPEFEVVGIYDPDPEKAEKAKQDHGVHVFESPEALIEASDAVDIVTPTLHHFDLAKQAMKAFRHVFIEKPITHTVEEAKLLIQLAREANVKAQVGHVERYNPAFLALGDREVRPMFIEGHRLAQWNPRGTDVSVVHDLMIHDLDIVLSMVRSEVKKVSASGVAVISDTPDIANARIEFHNGCVANLTASRISMKNMRKMRIFQRNAYLTLDFLDKEVELFNLYDEGQAPEGNLAFQFEHEDKKMVLVYDKPTVEPVNSIKLELEDFARSINEDAPVTVSLEQAATALETATLIADKINKLCIV